MSDVDSAPFAIVDEGDPRMVRVTRPDGRSFSLPRAAAEAQGVEIRQPAPAPVAPTPNPAVTPERVHAPPLGAQAPTPYSATSTTGPAPTVEDVQRSFMAAPVPPSTTGPAPTVEDVQRSFLVQPGPTRAPATDATTQALRDASARPAPRQPSPFEPTVGPTTSDVAALDMGRNLPAAEGETFVGLGGNQAASSQAPQAAPRRRRPAPEPVEDDKPFDVDEQLIDQLIERGDGEALARVGEEGNTPFADVNDARSSTQTERALYRLDDSRRLQQAAAETQQAAAIDRQAMLERQQAETEQLQAQRQQALGQAQRRYLDAYRTAQNTHVNPSRFYADRGVAGTIGIGIAMALGDVGAALTGGENRAAQIIEAAINRDMEAQRANQANAQAGVRNAQTFFDLTRQQFNDEEAALEAARSLAWNQVAQRTAAQMQGLASEEARINASALRDRAIAESQQAARAALQAEQDRELAMRRELLEQQGLGLSNEEQALDNARLQRRLSGAGGRGRGFGVVPAELIGTARDPLVMEAVGLGIPESVAMDMAADSRGSRSSGRARLQQQVASESVNRGRNDAGGTIPGWEATDSTPLMNATERANLRELVSADREFQAAVRRLEREIQDLSAEERIEGRFGFGSQRYQEIQHAVGVVRSQFRRISNMGNSLGAQATIEHEIPDLSANTTAQAILNNIRAAQAVKHDYVTSLMAAYGYVPSSGGGHGSLPAGVRPRGEAAE